MKIRIWALATFLAGGWACDDSQDTDGGGVDSAVIDSGADSGLGDQGIVDSGADDTGLSEVDGGAGDAETPDALPEDTGPADTGEVDSGVPEVLSLNSTAFAMSGVIPDRHTCGGPDLQPELSWTGIPAGTLSLALVLIDDSINFVHWIAYDLPPTLTSLPEGASDNGQLPAGAVEADAYCTQYCGPCPGTMHTYTFRLYALDVATTSYNWPNVIRATHLNAAFGGNSLGEARLTGTYTP
ncbi:MAG: YbhB/YbcL family Raf kinase inhibitor-like protein [Deltaproteobacteria bacterium]|nr:YbhB/YbcL family Raf kinase inhibitor-like protein [Deltaproteobacteria bacterium]